MSLLDKAVGLFGDGEAADSDGILSVVMDYANQHGGLQGLLQQFKDNGLADQVSSWIGTGENIPVSAEQITESLGEDAMAGIAEKMDLSPEEASASLAESIPKFVDQLSPQGELPEGDDLLSQGLDLIKGKLFG